jgi:thiamine biosynthesis protein ThiS
MITIMLNGQPHVTEAQKIEDLVAELGFVRGTVLVEHNGLALRPDEWPVRTLAPGDQIELLRVSAGG